MKMALPKMANAAFAVLLFCSAVSCMPTSQNADESSVLRVKRDNQLDQFQRRLVVDNNKGAMRTKIEDSYVLGGMHSSRTTMKTGASPMIMTVRAVRNEELPKVELDTPVAAPPATGSMVIEDGAQLAEGDDDAGGEQAGRADNDDYPVYDAEDYDGDDGAGSSPLVGRSIAILDLTQRQNGARADQTGSSDIPEQLKQMLLAKLKAESEKASSENEQREQGGRNLFNTDYFGSAEDSWRSARRQKTQNTKPLSVTLPLHRMTSLLMGRSLNREGSSGELQEQLLSQLLRGARRLSETRFMSASRAGGDSSNEVLRGGRARTRSSSAELTKSSSTVSKARGSSSGEQNRGGREVSSNGGIPKQLFVISPVDGGDKPGGFELKKISVS